MNLVVHCLQGGDDAVSICMEMVQFPVRRIGTVNCMQGLRAPNRKQKYEKICFSKLQITVGDLCKGHDKAFVLFFEHVRQLSFEETPDYTYVSLAETEDVPTAAVCDCEYAEYRYLRRILRDLFVEKGCALHLRLAFVGLARHSVLSLASFVLH